MSLNRYDALVKLNEFAINNGLDANDFFNEITKRNEVVDMYEVSQPSGYAIIDILNHFNPSMQTINVTQIENGSRTDLKNNLLNSIINIGRNEAIFNNLSTLNLERLKESIENDKLVFFSKEGKFYLESDGNHRLLQLKLLFAVEKLKTTNQEELNELTSRFSINVPVKYVEHEKELIEILSKINNENPPTKFDYLNQLVKSPNSFSNVITYNNQNDTYNINYKGNARESLTSEQATDILEKIHSKERSFTTHLINGEYFIEVGNVLKAHLTKEEWQKEINSLHQVATTTNDNYDYYIIEKPNDKNTLIIPHKKFEGSYNETLAKYSSVVQFNQQLPLEQMNAYMQDDLVVLNEEQVTEAFFENMQTADIYLDQENDHGVVEIMAREFKDISKAELNVRLQLLQKEQHPMEKELK